MKVRIFYILLFFINQFRESSSYNNKNSTVVVFGCSGNCNFDDSSSWIGGVVPRSIDSVVATLKQADVLTISRNISLDSMTLNGTGKLLLHGINAAIDINNFMFSGGQIESKLIQGSLNTDFADSRSIVSFRNGTFYGSTKSIVRVNIVLQNTNLSPSGGDSTAIPLHYN